MRLRHRLGIRATYLALINPRSLRGPPLLELTTSYQQSRAYGGCRCLRPIREGDSMNTGIALTLRPSRLCGMLLRAVDWSGDRFRRV